MSPGTPTPVCSGPRATSAQLPALLPARAGRVPASWAWAAGRGEHLWAGGRTGRLTEGRGGQATWGAGCSPPFSPTRSAAAWDRQLAQLGALVVVGKLRAGGRGAYQSPHGGESRRGIAHSETRVAPLCPCAIRAGGCLPPTHTRAEGGALWAVAPAGICGGIRDGFSYSHRDLLRVTYPLSLGLPILKLEGHGPAWQRRGEARDQRWLKLGEWGSGDSVPSPPCPELQGPGASGGEDGRR